jgi:hypothetical protein
MPDLSHLDDPTWCPKAVVGVEIHEAADGYILYQAEQERVHYLNRTAVILLALCTGKTRVDEMPGLLQSAFALGAPPAAETRACLERLVGESLIA